MLNDTDKSFREYAYNVLGEELCALDERQMAVQQINGIFLIITVPVIWRNCSDMKKFGMSRIVLSLVLIAASSYAVADSYKFRMFDGYISIPVVFSVNSIVASEGKCYEVVFSKEFEDVNYTDIGLMSYVMCNRDKYKFDSEQVKEVDRKEINEFVVVKLEYIDSRSKLRGKTFFRVGMGNATLYIFGEDGFKFASDLLETYEKY